MDVTLDPQARFDLDVPRGHTAVAYLFEGQALFGLDQAGQGVPVNAVSMVVFEDCDCLSVQASTDASARFMLIAGAPFREPIFPYGPFVMNTMEVIQQAMLDLRNGTFVQPA